MSEPWRQSNLGYSLLEDYVVVSIGEMVQALFESSVQEENPTRDIVTRLGNESTDILNCWTKKCPKKWTRIQGH